MKHEIIEHFKKFHGIKNMTEDYQIDIDWAEALVKDLGLVKNCSIPVVVGRSEQLPPKYIPCGGCGADNPNERCINCFHDFGGN